MATGKEPISSEIPLEREREKKRARVNDAYNHLWWCDSLVKVREQFYSARSIPPVSHEIDDNSKGREDVYSSSSHPIICIAGNTFAQSSRCVCIGINCISFLDE